MNNNQIKKSLKETPLGSGFFFISTIIVSFALLYFHESFLKSFTVLCKLIALNIIGYIVSNIMFRLNYGNIRKLFNENVLPEKLNSEDEVTLLLKVLLYWTLPWCSWLGLTLKLGGTDISSDHYSEFLTVAFIIPLCGYAGINAYHENILSASVLPSIKLKFILSCMLAGVLLTSLGYYFG